MGAIRISLSCLYIYSINKLTRTPPCIGADLTYPNSLDLRIRGIVFVLYMAFQLCFEFDYLSLTREGR